MGQQKQKKRNMKLSKRDSVQAGIMIDWEGIVMMTQEMGKECVRGMEEESGKDINYQIRFADKKTTNDNLWSVLESRGRLPCDAARIKIIK